MKMKLLLGLLLILTVGALPTMAQDDGGVVQIIGGEDNPEAVRELLTYQIAPNDTTATVYVASLPEELPFELPLPEAAHLVGSIVTHYGEMYAGGPQTYGQIYFSTDQSPEQVIAFYRESLSEQWEAGIGRPGYGFTDAPIANQQFCYQDDAFFLDLTAFTLANGQNRVSINYTTGGQFECMTNISEIPGEGVFVLIPILTSPEGVEIVTSHNDSPLQGGGGGGNVASVSAFLRSALTADEIATLYQPQLEAQGWTFVNLNHADGFASSTWTLLNEKNEPLGAYLVIRQSPVGENLYHAELVIEGKPR